MRNQKQKWVSDSAENHSVSSTSKCNTPELLKTEKCVSIVIMYEKELQALGLSEKEAKVFLASLELGPDTVQNIAKKSGINRPTAYVQIESLKKKGLMSEVEKGKKVLNTAESPERLSSLLNALEKELDFKKIEIKRILPALQELSLGAGERPKELEQKVQKIL